MEAKMRGIDVEMKWRNLTFVAGNKNIWYVTDEELPSDVILSLHKVKVHSGWDAYMTINDLEIDIWGKTIDDALSKLFNELENLSISVNTVLTKVNK